jgi:hypothetical protein
MWDLWRTNIGAGFSPCTSGLSTNHSIGLLHIHHLPLSGAGTMGQILADKPNELSLTPP